jgi:hypothetical protein
MFRLSILLKARLSASMLQAVVNLLALQFPAKLQEDEAALLTCMCEHIFLSKEFSTKCDLPRRATDSQFSAFEISGITLRALQFLLIHLSLPDKFLAWNSTFHNSGFWKRSVFEERLQRWAMP